MKPTSLLTHTRGRPVQFNPKNSLTAAGWDSWSFSHFDTITVSVADAPRPDEILVVMAIADGGRLRNRCGTEPIR
jgi:hypothetical protein